MIVDTVVVSHHTMKQIGHSCVKLLCFVSFPGKRGAIFLSKINFRAALISHGHVGYIL
jgi:hypothetical protein